MDLSFLYGRIWFDSFEDVVSWLCSGVPYALISLFILSCVFSIFETVSDWGRK